MNVFFVFSLIERVLRVAPNAVIANVNTKNNTKMRNFPIAIREKLKISPHQTMFPEPWNKTEICQKSTVSLDTSTSLWEFFFQFHFIVYTQYRVFYCSARLETSFNDILSEIFQKRKHF